MAATTPSAAFRGRQGEDLSRSRQSGRSVWMDDVCKGGAVAQGVANSSAGIMIIQHIGDHVGEASEGGRGVHGSVCRRD